MKFFGMQHVTWQQAIVVTFLVIVVVFVVGSVVMALLYPNVTSDYEFLRVPTLTPVFP